jgi:hypothetical protein
MAILVDKNTKVICQGIVDATQRARASARSIQCSPISSVSAPIASHRTCALPTLDMQSRPGIRANYGAVWRFGSSLDRPPLDPGRVQSAACPSNCKPFAGCPALRLPRRKCGCVSILPPRIG